LKEQLNGTAHFSLSLIMDVAPDKGITISNAAEVNLQQ